MVTLKNLILKYIGRKKINILKRKCHVEIDVVFLEVILKLYDVCFMKHIFIAPWTCLHRFDIHIFIRWPENVRRVNKICLHCGHFIHCYILLNFLLLVSSSWQYVTNSSSLMSWQNRKIIFCFCFGLSNCNIIPLLHI